MGWTAAIGASGLAITAGLMCAGAFVSHAFNHQSVLGQPLIADTELYPPWSVLGWTLRWGSVYPNVFAIAELIMGVGVLAGGAVAAAMLRANARVKPFGEKAWATFADAANNGLFAACGTVLGKMAGEVLCFDGSEHQLLVGASRSGKGRGHVVPTLLSWPRSALVLDVKGELDAGDTRHGFSGTSGFRAALGPVLRFAPTRAESNAFNPLLEVRRGANEVRDVQNIIEIIVDPVGDGRHQDFWDRSAKQVLVGVVLHVIYAEPASRKTLAVVREKLADLDRTAEEMRTTLHRVNGETGAPEVHPEVLHAARSYLSGEERLRSGVKATTESFFGLFADPIVSERTATSDFRIGDLMCGPKPVTLFLQPPPSDAARLMPLMRLLLNQIARALMEDQTHDAQGRVKRHQLLLLLDEFPQLGRMPFFETAMGAMAGYGLKAYLVCQSLNHVTRAYGRDNVIIDNCAVVTAFAAADMDTAKRIADMAGETWEVRPQESEHRPRAFLGLRKGTITYREERRPLLLPGDVRALARDEQLVFVSGMKPLRAKKLRFDTERVFAARLRPRAVRAATLAQQHDWLNVVSLGRLAQETRAVSGSRAIKPRPEPPHLTTISGPTPTTPPQPDLFAEAEAPASTPAAPPRAITANAGARKISEIALAGFREPREAADEADVAQRPKATGV